MIGGGVAEKGFGWMADGFYGQSEPVSSVDEDESDIEY